MRKYFITIIFILFSWSFCLAANDDISDRAELGTAVSGDAILGVDASASAGDRLRRILFNGTSTNCLAGNGTWFDLSTKQAADADLTTWATVTPSANGQSLVSAANYAAMRTLLDIEPGVDYDAATPSTLPLTTDTSITEAQLLTNKYITNQGASGEVDITLPAVSYHITRTVIVEETQIIEMNPPSGETFDLSGTVLTADYCIDSPATVGAKAVFTRMQNDSGTWIWSVDTVRGTWVDTGATD